MKKIVVFITIFLFLAGCAGRVANPTTVYQIGDERRSCKALEIEISFVKSEITRLIPETKKTGKNIVLGITGWFLLVPWFFMDFSKAEQVEINALRQRYNHLMIMADEKGCNVEKVDFTDNG